MSAGHSLSGRRPARGDTATQSETARSDAGVMPRRFKDRFLPRSLLGRSLLIIVTPLILVQLVTGWVFYDRHYDTITKRLAQGLAGDVATVISMIGRVDSGEERGEILREAQVTMWLNLSYETGGELPPGAVPERNSILDRKLVDSLEERLAYSFMIYRHRSNERVQIDVELADGLLTVLVPQERLFSSTTYLFVFWMIGTSCLVAGIAVLFMRNQVRPIQRLAKAAELFGKGQDVTRFKPEGATEVRQAGSAFLQMKQRINRQIQQRTDMLAGVSHDLRTPLTRMKLQLAMLRNSPDVENLQSDVAEMERMLEGYLAFARGEGTEQPAPVALGALLKDVVGQMTRDGGVIDLHVEEDMELPLRREAIRRCLSNLIGNARSYGDQVAIRAGRRGQHYEITIDDDGPGIPETEREEVFKPFFRRERSRNPSTGGIGLGLTIARDVVRNHGGDILLEDAPAGGLRARVRLPL